ncbi:MAG TPA: helix-turn-helix transcriptional regulator [Patescibacteria group bacterium]|nr:helix-turn-helix transcriptional regulator [Patescibacteria group bacterium]
MKSSLDPRQVLLLSLLRNGRVSSNITQTSIAESLGKPQSWVSKVETGELELSVVDFLSLCNVLKLDATQVITALTKGQDE